MAFSRRFPRDVPGSAYPSWEEFYLSPEEERKLEEKQRATNVALMKECIADAQEILKEGSLKDFQTNVIQLAVSLFEKRSSHTVYWKEEAAKEKFDQQFRKK